MFVSIDILKYSNVLMYLNEEHTKLLSEYILYKKISCLNVDIKIYYDG